MPFLYGFQPAPPPKKMCGIEQRRMDGKILAGLGLAAAILVCILAQRTFVLVFLLGMLVLFVALKSVAVTDSGTKNLARSETITRHTVDALLRPRRAAVS